MIKYLEGKTLQEKQQFYYNGHRCPYCDKETEWVDSLAVYRESYGMIFFCRPCDAWVNCHGQSQDQAFGFVAKKSLRSLRHVAHEFFDPLIAAKVRRGMTKKQAQAAGRAWLAKILNIDIAESHMGMMDEDQCKAVIVECKKYYMTPEQVEHRKKLIEERIKTVYFSGSKFQYSVSRFDLNGVIQLSLISLLSGGVANYKPIEQLAVGIAETKWLPVPDLEEWISDQFADPYRPVRRNRKLKNVSKND